MMDRLARITSRSPSAKRLLGNSWGTEIYDTAIAMGASDPEAEGIMYMGDYDEFANLTVRQALQMLRESKS